MGKESMFFSAAVYGREEAKGDALASAVRA